MRYLREPVPGPALNRMYRMPVPPIAAPIDLPPTYREAMASSPSGSSLSSLSCSPSTSGSSSRSVSPPRLGRMMTHLNNMPSRSHPSGTIYPERPHGPLRKDDVRPQHFAATGTLPHAIMDELNAKLADVEDRGARIEVELQVAQQTLQRRREVQASEPAHPSAPTLFSISGGLHVDDDPVPNAALEVSRAEKEVAKLNKKKDALLKERDHVIKVHLKRMQKLDGKLQQLTSAQGVSAAASRH